MVIRKHTKFLEHSMPIDQAAGMRQAPIPMKNFEICHPSPVDHGHKREQHQTRSQLLIPSTLWTNDQRNVIVTSLEERQRDPPTWVPTLLRICEADLEEVSGHERQQHQTRRRLLNPSPLRNDNTSAQWKRLAATMMMFPPGNSQA